MSDDFCNIHGYERMVRTLGQPVAHCEACDERDAAFDKILRDVAELPDRTSPEDQPDMMLVTADELRTILCRHL